MKYLFIILFSTLALQGLANPGKDSTINYNLPDSVKAVQFIANVQVSGTLTRKEATVGIKTDLVQLCLESEKEKKEIVFKFPRSAKVVTTGLNVSTKEKGELSWKYEWKTGETYRLLLAVATDSAENFLLYSGYIWLPEFNKWKLVGTCRITGRWNTIQQPAAVVPKTNDSFKASVNNVWVQRNNNSWKHMESATGMTSPVINLLSHIDSVDQFQLETNFIKKAIQNGSSDVKDNIEGVYYRIINEGTGRQVTVNDTVTVFYKLTMMNDTAIIDQAKDTPARFPLKRLIKGWQLGVPLLRTGGKIKLVIPSALAYSIRTRAADIPPNSILEFEIEVVDAKSPQ